MYISVDGETESMVKIGGTVTDSLCIHHRIYNKAYHLPIHITLLYWHSGNCKKSYPYYTCMYVLL